MNISDSFVIFGVLSLLVIMGIRLWNILNKCQWIDNWRIVAVLFVSTLLSWFFVFLGSMSILKISSTNIIYQMLLQVSNFMLMLNIIFLIIEFALYSTNQVVRQTERT